MCSFRQRNLQAIKEEVQKLGSELTALGPKLTMPDLLPHLDNEDAYMYCKGRTAAETLVMCMRRTHQAKVLYYIDGHGNEIEYFLDGHGKEEFDGGGVLMKGLFHL